MIRQNFDIGDLVEIDVPYNKESSKLMGLVVASALINPGTNSSDHVWHDDEYHCKVRILKPVRDPGSDWENDDTRWVRAKWLKQIAKVNFSS